MRNTKIAKAVSLALAGAALSVGVITDASAAATTMYNMNNFGGLSTNTDGWVWGNSTTPAAGPANNLTNYQNFAGQANFVGTASPTSTPFGYNGTSHLNWAASLGVAGDSATISAADSTQYSAAGNYSGPAEIDTGAGAWQDTGINSSGNPTASGPTGWRHQTDIGLIKADQDMWVTLNPSVVPGGAPAFVGNFGITVFTGMDTNSGSYSHHGAWNCPGCSPARPYNASNPFATTGLTYLTHDGTVDALNGLTFYAVANQVYSIYLGGAGVGRWNQNLADYSLAISSAPVPVPAAAWLFGGALTGLIGVHRRRRVVPA